MQAVTLILIPAGMTFAIWRAYRTNSRAPSASERFAPSGKIRWESRDQVTSGDEA